MNNNTRKKILLVYATAGIGHVKAAFAVKDALEKHKGQFIYETVDILDYTNSFLKWIYHKFYIILVKHVPVIWAAIYYSLDIPIVFNCIKHLRTMMNKFNSKKFADYLSKMKPDIIVSTHFFPSEVISALKRKKIINSRLISIITDFKLHTYWVSKEVDLFVVANENLKEELRHSGVDEERIKALGVPIESKFYESLDKDSLYQKFGLQKGHFTILIAGGGFGVGPVEEIVKELTSIDLPMQLLVVCGKNRLLYEKVKGLQKISNVPVKVYGFVDNMHELMEISDLLISKTGGMTTSEAIAKELPMIIVSPVPGQEMRNCAFMIDNNTAIREDNPSRIKDKIIELSDNTEKLAIMKRNIKSIKKSNSALNLINFMATL